MPQTAEWRLSVFLWSSVMEVLSRHYNFIHIIPHVFLQFFPIVCRKFSRDFEFFFINTAQGQSKTYGKSLGCSFCAFKETFMEGGERL